MESSPPATPANVWPWLRCFLVLGAHLLFMLILLFVLGAFVPVYMDFFEEQNLALPTITQQLYAVSEYAVAYWYLFFFVGLLVDVSILVILTLSGGRWRWLLSIYEYAWLLGTCLFLFWVAICVTMPIEKMLQAKHP